MVTSLREVFISFALVGIIVFATISFIVSTQTQNNVENTILEDDIIFKVYNQTNTTLLSFRDNASSQKGNFEKEFPERGFGSLIIFAIVGVGQTFTDMILGVYNVFIILPSRFLQIPPQVISAITAILIVTLVLLAWRVYRVGS